MNRKEQVLNLFGFLIELLEEPTTPKKIEESKETSDSLGIDVSKAKELMEKISDLDNERANDLKTNRAVINATKPLRDELDKIKQDWLNEKTIEEKFLDRTGVTLDED